MLQVILVFLGGFLVFTVVCCFVEWNAIQHAYQRGGIMAVLRMILAILGHFIAGIFFH